MRSIRLAMLMTLLLGIVAGSPIAVRAAEPCAEFKWDVSREHALFVGPATSLSAGKDTATAATIAPDHLYELKLLPQTETVFAAPPGKRLSAEGAHAGMLTLRIAAAGRYRVSVDAPFWIDVVDGGSLVASKDYQGNPNCDAPHKIVEYDLAAAPVYILQLSGSTKASARLTVTQVSPPKP